MIKRVLITGAGSYVGENVKKYIEHNASDKIEIDTIDTIGDKWKSVDFSRYHVVFHVAGIAEVNGKKDMSQLYYTVNTNLTLEIARYAKKAGVKQFIFMSSMIVYKETQSLKGNVIGPSTEPKPNGVYGDSKLRAEQGLLKLGNDMEIEHTPSAMSDQMKICILRPPMIYGPNSQSNLSRLGRLGLKLPIFPNWRNKRSMLYIDNLSEFVKECILRELEGVFYPQNKELSATIDIIRIFAKKYDHRIWITPLLNPLVWLGSFILQPVNKMFADSYYLPEMSNMDFDYQLVDFEDSLLNIDL